MKRFMVCCAVMMAVSFMFGAYAKAEVEIEFWSTDNEEERQDDGKLHHRHAATTSIYDHGVPHSWKAAAPSPIAMPKGRPARAADCAGGRK